MEPNLKIDNLNFSFKDKVIFENLSLEVEKGKIVSIIGPNKCGKTTLIKLISGFYPTTDKIYVNEIAQSKKTFNLYLRKLGVVLPHPKRQFLFPTVEDELIFPLENLAYPNNEIANRLRETIELFSLKDLLNKNPKYLSLSDMQKITIAIATLHNPKVLVIDDALSLLDDKTKQEIKTILIKLKEDGMTILMTTNNLEDCMISDEVYIINNHHIIAKGEPLKLFEDDKQLIHLGLEVPFMLDLSIKLKFYEVVKEMIPDMERMVDELWK